MKSLVLGLVVGAVGLVLAAGSRHASAAGPQATQAPAQTQRRSRSSIG